MEKAASSFLPLPEKRWAKITITINPTRTAVAIYPKADWDGQLEEATDINLMDKIGLQYERYPDERLFSGNSMDAQGRVLIPAKLRAKICRTRATSFSSA